MSVWKIPGSRSKPAFRFWLDAADNQLNAIQGFSKPEIVLEHARRMETLCTNPAFDQMLGEINKNREKVDPCEWDFERKPMLL